MDLPSGSLPSAILLLLMLGGLGGCDRQDSSAGQAAAPAASPRPSPSPSAQEGERVIVDTIGTLDRSHKGEAAPALDFATPGGGRTSIAAFAGRPVLLNLWATWCAPCVAEMPTLDQVARRMQVVAVSQDLDGAAAVAPFLAHAGLKNIAPYLDPAVTLSTAYQAQLPTSILYDSAGREVWRMTGGMDWTTETARELLAEAG